MLVRVAFARADSAVDHNGQPTYPGEPVVVELGRVLGVDREAGTAFVADQDGNAGWTHLSRLYNVYSDASDGEVELASWGAAL